MLHALTTTMKEIMLAVACGMLALTSSGVLGGVITCYPDETQ